MNAIFIGAFYWEAELADVEWALPHATSCAYFTSEQQLDRDPPARVAERER
jgi:hypothetical protein